MQGHGAGDEVRYGTRAWEMEGAWDYGTRVWDKGMVKGMSQGYGVRVRLWDKGMGQGKWHWTMGQRHGTRHGLRDYGIRTRDKAWAKGIWA